MTPTEAIRAKLDAAPSWCLTHLAVEYREILRAVLDLADSIDGPRRTCCPNPRDLEWFLADLRRAIGEPLGVTE